jgi:hypothetical protein
LALADLLQAGPEKFLVAHASDEAGSDRYYLFSWALALDLTFEQRLLGTPSLDDYVRSLKAGADSQEAFCRLTGKALPLFEQQFHHYLLRLRSGGTLSRP